MSHVPVYIYTEYIHIYLSRTHVFTHARACLCLCFVSLCRACVVSRTVGVRSAPANGPLKRAWLDSGVGECSAEGWQRRPGGTYSRGTRQGRVGEQQGNTTQRGGEGVGGRIGSIPQLTSRLIFVCRRRAVVSRREKLTPAPRVWSERSGYLLLYMGVGRAACWHWFLFTFFFVCVGWCFAWDGAPVAVFYPSAPHLFLVARRFDICCFTLLLL